MQVPQTTSSARRYFQKFSEWEITHTDTYKRLHYRFAAAITFFAASAMWNIFFFIDPKAAKDLWWMFVVAIPFFIFLLWRLKLKEQSL